MADTCKQETIATAVCSFGVTNKSKGCPDLHSVISATVRRSQYQPVLLYELTTFLKKPNKSNNTIMEEKKKSVQQKKDHFQAARYLKVHVMSTVT